MKGLPGSIIATIIATVIALLVFGVAESADTPSHLPVKKSGEIGGDVTLTYDLKPPPESSELLACSARVEISYSQMNDKVRVETTVINDDCAASYGEYSVQLRTRDELGETHVRSIDESWARDTSADIEFDNAYDMDGDVELIWARVNRVSCTCSAAEGPGQ